MSSQLGETPAELIKYYKQTRSSQRTVSWIEMLMHAEALGQAHRPQLSVQKYQELQAMFPRNAQVLLGLARQYANADRKSEAKQAFAMVSQDSQMCQRVSIRIKNGKFPQKWHSNAV